MIYALRRCIFNLFSNEFIWPIWIGIYFRNLLERTYTIDTTLTTTRDSVVIKDGDQTQSVSAKTKNLYTSLNRQIQIKIKYKEDDDGTLEKGVIFSSLISKKITTPLFDQWNCGQNHEDERCSKVRQGLFRWSTTYTITFLGKLLQCFCKLFVSFYNLFVYFL